VLRIHKEWLPVNENDQESKIANEHLAARNDVISEYGTLWRQAIEKAGVNDEVAFGIKPLVVVMAKI